MDKPSAPRPPAAVALSGAAWPAERAYQLLAVLASRSGEWVARDELAALFWPERHLADARRNLRKVIFRARELPLAAALEVGEHALRWTVTTEWQRLKSGPPADVPALHRGPLLAGLDDAALPEFSDWLAAERRRFDAAWREGVLAQLPSLPEAAQRAALATRLLALDPLDEDAMAALIDAECAQGHAATAQRHFQDYARRLATTLGVEPARSLRDRLPAPAAAPPADEGFIGRRLELAEIEHRLRIDGERLLTVLGPGGVGKSRLARAALARLAPTLGGRAAWVDLQDLVDPAAVGDRLVQALALGGSPGPDAVERVCSALGESAALIVLDNAEHLPDLPPLLARLLGRCPRLQLMATSRARLAVAGESLLRLDGLAVPDEDSRDLEAAEAFDAVRLFVDRARRARREFQLAPHLEAVIRIVEAVGGLPLAIELAAGWVRMLPPQEIARELEASIDVLERDPGAAEPPDRPAHQSLRRTLDQTWGLLGPSEREAMAALSVFEGGFTRAAAQAVAGVSLPLLSSLVDRSMLAVDAAGRFGLHPVVQSYAADRAAADGAPQAAVRRRHAEHFARHLAALAPHALGDQRQLVAGVSAEFANCRAAWQRALQWRDAALVGEMVRALWSYFENRGRLGEGIALIRPALALGADAPLAARAQQRVRHGLSMLLHRAGLRQESLAVAEAGIRLGEGCGDLEAYVGCILNTGSNLNEDAQAQAAHARFEQALAIAERHADAHCIAWALGNLGVTHSTLGRWSQAADCLQRALASDRERGNAYQVAVHLVNLAALCYDQDDFGGVVDWSEQGLAHSQANELLSFATVFRQMLAAASRRLGRNDEARRHYEAVLEELLVHGGYFGVSVNAIVGLARLDIASGDFGTALRRLQDGGRRAARLAARQESAYVLNAWAAWLAEQGRARDAARVWRRLLAGDGFTPVQRREIEDRLHALPPAAAADGEPPTLAALLEALLAET